MNPIPIRVTDYKYIEDGSLPIQYKDKKYSFTMAYEIISKIPTPDPRFWKGKALTREQLLEKWKSSLPVPNGHIYEFLGNWAFDL